MVDVYFVVCAAVALFIMIGIPVGFLMLHFHLDGLHGRKRGFRREWRPASKDQRRGLRALRRQQGIPIEELAATLRRLRVAVATDAHRSAAHQMGNRLAYDRVLIDACLMLDIQHSLHNDSIGFERDIERFRVEAELEGAGVIISGGGYSQAA